MLSFSSKIVLIFFLELISGTFHKNLYNLVNNISDKYFQVFQCLTFTLENVEILNYLKPQMPAIIIKLSAEKEKKNSQGDLMTESFDQGCGAHIIQAKPEKRWQLIKDLVEAKTRAEGNRYNKERYLFLPTGENDTDLNIFLHPQIYFLPNCLLITPTVDAIPVGFALNTHTVFNPDIREHFEVTDTWFSTEGFRNNADLYPDKVKNIKGKELVFGLTHYAPYSLVLKDKNKVVYDGIDVRLAAEFANKVNGKWIGVDHPVELWGTKFSNGSGNGVFGSVQANAVDLGYGGFYQWYCDVLDCSYPYIQSSVTCLVPKPQVLSGWVTVFLPFTTTTWIGLSAVFLISILFVFILSLAEKHIKGLYTSSTILPEAFLSFYIILRLQIQQIPKVVDYSPPLATFVRVSTFFFFFVAILWQGGIASTLTSPRYEVPINSAFDLVSRWPKVNWGGIHEAWVNSVVNSSDPILQGIVEHFLVLDNLTLLKKTKTRNFGFLIEMLPNGHYGFNDFINEKTVSYLRLMEHGIYSDFGVLILPRGSPFTEKLDHIIHWMFSTGIIQKIEVQVYLERMNNNLQNMIKYSDEKERVDVKLALKHLEAPIYTYLIGVSLSITAIIAEKFFI